MSSLAGTIVRGGETIPALLERTRETFGTDSAELVDRPPPPGTDSGAVVVVPAGPGSHLVLRGRTLASSERRVLAAFAAHVGSAVERAWLAQAAAEVEPVRAADRMRTALLRAVGHDLRTPLAAGWAAVASLRSRDVEFSAADRDELLATADESMAKLNRLVENLFDLSRLQAGRAQSEPAGHRPGGGAPGGARGRSRGRGPRPGEAPGRPRRPAAPGTGDRQPGRQRRPAHPRGTTGAADRQRPRGPGRGAGRGPRSRYPAVGPRPPLRALPAAGRHRQLDRSGVSASPCPGSLRTEAMDGTLVPEDTPGGGLTMVLSLPCARDAQDGADRKKPPVGVP